MEEIYLIKILSKQAVNKLESTYFACFLHTSQVRNVYKKYERWTSHKKREKVKIYSQLKIEMPICKTKPCKDSPLSIFKPCIDSPFSIFFLKIAKKFNKCKKKKIYQIHHSNLVLFVDKLKNKLLYSGGKKMKQENTLKYSVKKSNFYKKIPFMSKCH